MSVAIYWKERLHDGFPLYSPDMRDDPDQIKAYQPGSDDWPKAVARSALFTDYRLWYEKEYLEEFRSRGFEGDELPTPVDELGFYNTVSPWLYVVGKKEQVRMYRVVGREEIDGESVEKLGTRYFIRLSNCDHHISAFLADTGIDVFDGSSEYVYMRMIGAWGTILQYRKHAMARVAARKPLTDRLVKATIPGV